MNLKTLLQFVFEDYSPTKEREQAYHNIDKKDIGDWHYITARSVGEAYGKLKKYLGKDEAENIVLDDHGGYVEGTNNPGIVINENDQGVDGNSFDKYSVKNTGIAKTAIDAILGIGKLVSKNGNYIIASCLAGSGEKGTHMGKRISSLLGDRNLYLNTGFSRPTLLSLNLNNTGLKPYGNLDGRSFVDKVASPHGYIKKFSSGQYLENGDIHLSQSGQVFKFLK